MIILSLCTQSCLHRLGYTAIWCYVMVTLPQQTTLTPGLCCRLTFLVIFLVSKLSPRFLFPSPAAGAADVLSDAANGGVFLYWPWCWCCWNPYIQEKATGSRFLRDYTQAHVHICILSGYHSSRIWLAPRCGAPFEWTRVPERGTHWYHGRRGGANRVLLNIKHMTAPPFFFLASPSKAAWWLVKNSGACINREECRADHPPAAAAAVPWYIKSRISHTEGCFYGYPMPWVVLIRLPDILTICAWRYRQRLEVHPCSRLQL